MNIETYIFFRELEDKQTVELAEVTIKAPAVKAQVVSQYIDLRTEQGETFATVTFPSWVKVRKVGSKSLPEGR